MKDHVDEFSRKGLRTLLLGYRWLSPDEHISWHERYEALRGSTMDSADKEKGFAAMHAEMETSLNLIGVTGVEDKL